MPRFWKSCKTCAAWLLISEVLCLVLAFSFAILRAEIFRFLSAIFGILAHCLLMGSCAQNIAKEDVADYRLNRNRIPLKKPLLLAILTTVPGYILFLLLCIRNSSILMMNLFILLNAPFHQIYRLLLSGAETFASLSVLRQIVFALLPLITGAAFFIGYQTSYIPAVAKLDADSSRS